MFSVADVPTIATDFGEKVRTSLVVMSGCICRFAFRFTGLPTNPDLTVCPDLFFPYRDRFLETVDGIL
ncbi:hypothetical protein ACFLU2_03135, partial [Chloroflexota bacterium]